MNRPELRLDEHMIDAASQADVARQWLRIEAKLAKPVARGHAWLLIPGAVGAAVAVALVLSASHVRPSAPSAPAPSAPMAARRVAAPVGPQALAGDGARVETGSETARTLALADGSRIALGAGGSVLLAHSGKNEVRLVLERGKADFDVLPDAGRRFVVAVADVDFVIAGARFVVSVSDGAAGKTVTAAVERGTVEVRRPNARSLLLAGESWSGGVTATPAASNERGAAPEDARSLLAVATRARWQGRQRDAAAALEKLCRRFPNDPRAALAAFELGRIQLDTLHEPARAAQSFQLAMTLAREPVLREDAAARRTEALDRGGDASACRSAREAYLSEYPTGAHAGRVTGFCRDR
jgi:transmembrane sensor